MYKYAVFAAALIVSFGISAPLLAQEACEVLPPDIDEDERYEIRFRGEQTKGYKILEIEDCWLLTFRTDGNHKWWPIKSIEYIFAEPMDD